MAQEAPASLFPQAFTEHAEGPKPGWQDPEARLYKSLVARESELPNPILWYHSELIKSAYDATELTCPRCHFVNIITSATDHNAHLHSNQCMLCGTVLVCPVCEEPLEIGNPLRKQIDLVCANHNCDVWIGIW